MIFATVVGRVRNVVLHDDAGDGVPILNFHVISTRRQRDGEKVTTAVSAALWGSRANAFARHLHDGDTVVVSGSLDMLDDRARPILSLRADRLEILD